MLKFGNLPEWIGALGTVGALAGSLILIGRQMGEWKQAAEDKRRRWAENVTAWVQDYLGGEQPFPLIVLRVANSNPTAIYHVALNLNVGVRGRFYRWLDTLGPYETREIKIPLPGAPRSNLLVPDVAFVDASGRGWTRKNGELLPGQSADIFDEDPGAYRTTSEHPTMNIRKGDAGTRIYPPAN